MVHVGDALLGRHALQVGALAVLPVDLLALFAGRGFEKPARHRLVAGDHRGRLVAADMAMDIDGEPFSAGMRRAWKAPRDTRTGRQAGEQHPTFSSSECRRAPLVATLTN